MCRLYGFRANERTKVECSLVLAQNALLSQSRADSRGKSHADGWGIATYEDHCPLVERRTTPAFATLHFGAAAERLYSRTVIAHVRRATVSGPSPRNTHPFVHGPWTFAHNGTVRGFDSVAKDLVEEISEDLLAERRGETDSELVFLWILSRMRIAGIPLNQPGVDAWTLAAQVSEAVRVLAERSDRSGAGRQSELNLLLTDGDTMVATRWRNSLFYAVRDGIRDCEICGIPHTEHDPRVQYRAAVVASEPITHESWREVPEGATLVVSADLGVGVAKL